MNSKTFQRLTQWFVLLAVLACIMIFLGARTTQRFSTVTEHQVQLIQTADAIRYNNEEINTALRMITYTGDMNWEPRYHDARQKLTQSMQAAAQLLTYEPKELVAIESASLLLSTTEQEAFDLIREGKTRPASGLLLSSNYLQSQRVHSEGIQRFIENMRLHQRELKLAFEREINLVGLAMFGLILLISYIVYRMYKIVDRRLELGVLQSHIAKRLASNYLKQADDTIDWVLKQLCARFHADSVWLTYRQIGETPHLVRTWSHDTSHPKEQIRLNIATALRFAKEDANGQIHLQSTHKSAAQVSAFEAVAIQVQDQYEYMLSLLGNNNQKLLWSDEDEHVLRGVCEALVRTLEHQKQVLELEKFASLDGLTGLFNRRRFDTLFEQEREHCQRAPLASALMMIDIDWFKKVNDQYGHIVGDEVLIGLTHMLKQALRKNDIAGRIGGEEFAVILPSSSTEQAMDAAERFRSYVQRTGIPTQAGELHITISIGVTMFQRRDVTITEILKRADDAMYASKQNGRNRVTLG